MPKRIVLELAVLLILCSCGSTKKIAYFQDLGYESETSGISQPTTVIKPGDQLIIVVTSSKPELALPYNLYSVRSQMGQSTQAANLSSTTYGNFVRNETEGYMVDIEGYINFPVLGRIHVAGLTREEISKMLEATLRDFMPDPIVTVTFINFKITVLGEVARPGAYNVSMDRISLLDALGMAGDMTVYGERSNILIIRETNGVRETARLNIKSKSILASPYFYLQQNDVVVVEPIGARTRSISPFVQNLPLFVSLGSLVTSVLTLVFTFTK